MNPRFAVLLLVVLGITAHVAHGARSLSAKQPVRLYSLTQFNATANLPKMMAAEMEGAKACGATVKAGFMGIHANMSVTSMWGSLIKIYDFESTDDFITYQSCSDKSPTRSVTKPFESGKLYCMSDLPSNVKSINGSAFVHASLANVSNTTTYITKRSAMLSAFSGMSTTFDVNIDNGFFAPKYPGKVWTNSAVNIAFTAPQAGPAYNYYKKGFGNVPALPLYNEIKVLQAPPLGSSSFEIEFMPVSIK